MHAAKGCTPPPETEDGGQESAPFIHSQAPLSSGSLGQGADSFELREMREQLAREKRLVDPLLDNMLPADAVRELKATGKVAPQRFEKVAVLFVDLVSLTSYCDRHTPEEVVGSLGDPFILSKNARTEMGWRRSRQSAMHFSRQRGC